MSDYELRRLRAVESAVRRCLAEPGHITRAEITAALAAEPETTDPVTDTVEETV